MMKTSPNGIELIKEGEGLELTAYKCSSDVWTIGYGHTSAAGHPQVSMGLKIDKHTAEKILKKDLIKFEQAVRRLVTVDLNQNQFDALVSLVYNIGEPAFKRSTLRKLLNKGLYDKVPYEFARWNKSRGRVMRGLTRRRAVEAALWSTPVEEEKDTVHDHVTAERDVPSIINKENLSAAGALASGVGVSNLDPASPIAWALALIMVIGAGVFLYLFFRRRGA